MPSSLPLFAASQVLPGHMRGRAKAGSWIVAAKLFGFLKSTCFGEFKPNLETDNYYWLAGEFQPTTVHS